MRQFVERLARRGDDKHDNLRQYRCDRWSQPSAAAWCAIVIDINTRGGTMANKQFLQSGLGDPAKIKAVTREAVNRRNQILAITTPEIKDAMTHELEYYAAALNDPAGMGDFTLANIQALSSFQKTQCGIGGI